MVERPDGPLICPPLAVAVLAGRPLGPVFSRGLATDEGGDKGDADGDSKFEVFKEGAF